MIQLGNNFRFLKKYLPLPLFRAIYLSVKLKLLPYRINKTKGTIVHEPELLCIVLIVIDFRLLILY